VFDGNPAISARVVSFNDVRGTSAAPSADHEHNLVRYSRSCYWVGQVDVLAFLHVKVVQELDRLDDDRLALLVVVNQRVFLNKLRAVASLGLVSPGAATEGVTPEKLTAVFYSSPSVRLPVLQCHPYLFAPEKTDDLFLLITVTFIDFTRVSPPGGCHPAPFSPARPRLSIILCKFTHKNFPSGVTPWRVSPGAVRSPQ